ncbi:SMP-30/gluconolactonase/LRE family protein [Polyangium fumosum]|uniref:Uncharacterized protein n=1 Tax=Polyangium fumosum TaxID=889272 RepID=A0A4U1JL15_9BACT|nr:SMP-30/gluconolactonase/LRE family protein [Polyangium fumosum]TKD12593.1 hypothetical protein E8A74_02230 [Polyangium fumosum]
MRLLHFAAPFLLVVSLAASGCSSDVASSSGDGAASASSSSSAGGAGGMGGMGGMGSVGGGSSSSSGTGAGGVACTDEVCNGLDDDCDGAVDEDASLCPGPGEVCAAGACKADCVPPEANPCAPDTVCNVSDKDPGACVAPDAGCVVTGPLVACGASTCGPGTTCDAATNTCVASLPCAGIECLGAVCRGVACPCERPAPTCTGATLEQLNAAAFVNGLVDIDFDLACNAWGVTVISGPDYLRKVSTTGQVSTVQGVTNLNMGEVAAIQGQNGTFGGSVTEVGLTYNCCANCGCQGTPQGVAFFDQMTNALPLVIPSAKITTGAGPFKSGYLDTGPQGLTWGLTKKLYVGNVDADGDFHTVDLADGTKGLVATLPARVYAASPYDGSRLLVALATKEVVLLDVNTGATTPFAALPADITSLARDPFTGHVYVSLFGGEIHDLDGSGNDLGMFAKGAKSGRIALARDNHLYHVNAAPVGGASIERFPLPQTY